MTLRLRLALARVDLRAWLMLHAPAWAFDHRGLGYWLVAGESPRRFRIRHGMVEPILGVDDEPVGLGPFAHLYTPPRTLLGAVALVDPCGSVCDRLGLHASAIPPTLPAEAVVRRWAIIGPALDDGRISVDEAREMVLPELGEAWARTVAQRAGIGGVAPSVLIGYAADAAEKNVQAVRTALLVDEAYPDG